MNEYERDEATHERTCLRLATWDMDQANTAAICIPHPTYQNVRAVMQTGLVVAYARPFTTSKARPPLNLLHFGPAGRASREGWAPESDHDLVIHRQLMTLRDKVYAHTDKTTWRTVVREGVRWSWMTPEFLADVAAMTERQRERFRAAARARRVQLDAAD